MPMGTSYVRDARRLLLIMFFCCCFVLSSQRINMSIAIVNMVNYTAVYRNSSVICHTHDKSTLNSEDGVYLWSLTVQTQVLVSYFYGLALMQFPAEFLVEWFNVRYVALIGMIISSVCTYVTPEISEWSTGALIYLQITKAIGHAVVIPAFSIMTGQWIPTKKLVRFIATATSGIPTGAAFTLMSAGILNSGRAMNWTYIFYISGVLGFVWCVFWLYLCSISAFSSVLFSSRNIVNFPKNDLPIPFRKIFTSKPVLGYIAAGVATYWMVALNIFILPTYVRLVFGLGVEWNSLMSSLPNVLQAFVYLMTFKILRKKTTDKTTVRRLTACIGMSIFATCMILLTFVGCKQSLGILLMLIAIGASGFNIASLSIIPVDMSTNFSGILSGLMNTIGSFAGCGLPLLVGFFLSEERTIIQWSRVFYACGFVTFICMILFMAYSSCETQPWNNSVERTPLVNTIPFSCLSGQSKIIQPHQSSFSRLLGENSEPSTSKSKKCPGN